MLIETKIPEFTFMAIHYFFIARIVQNYNKHLNKLLFTAKLNVFKLKKCCEFI